MSVLRTGRGACRWGGGGEVEFLTEKKFPLRNVPGVLKRKKIKFGGGGVWGAPPGGRAGSENDTLLPMTMICDRLKFWRGPAWRSKIIIRKPWRRKNKKKIIKKKKKKKNSDKTIRHSRREAGNA